MAGEEVVGEREVFEIREVEEEAEVAGEAIGREVEGSERGEGGEIAWDFAGETVVSEIEDLEVYAEGEFGREWARDAVVREGEFTEVGEAPDVEGDGAGEAEGGEMYTGCAEGRTDELAGDAGDEAGVGGGGEG